MPKKLTKMLRKFKRRKQETNDSAIANPEPVKTSPNSSSINNNLPCILSETKRSSSPSNNITLSNSSSSSSSSSSSIKRKSFSIEQVDAKIQDYIYSCCGFEEVAFILPTVRKGGFFKEQKDRRGAFFKNFRNPPSTASKAEMWKRLQLLKAQGLEHCWLSLCLDDNITELQTQQKEHAELKQLLKRFPTPWHEIKHVFWDENLSTKATTIFLTILTTLVLGWANFFTSETTRNIYAPFASMVFFAIIWGALNIDFVKPFNRRHERLNWLIENNQRLKWLYAKSNETPLNPLLEMNIINRERISILMSFIKDCETIINRKLDYLPDDFSSTATTSSSSSSSATLPTSTPR